MPREHLERYMTPAQITRSRRLASAESAATDDRHVAFDPDLVRGPSPEYSGRSRYRALEVTTIEMSSVSSDDVGYIDEPGQQLLNETQTRNEAMAEDTRILKSSNKSRVRSRPVTEAYEQQEALSSLSSVHPVVNHHKVLRQLSEAHQDLEVCRRVHKLRAEIIDFAQAYVVEIKQNKHQPSVQVLCSNVENAKLVRYIGFLAQGGANGLHSWEELLTDEESLTALVVGIVGHALKEHVFSSLWFGGTPEEIDILEKLQEAEKDQDGYHRTKQRALKCSEFDRRALIGVSNYVPAAAGIAIGLRKLLTPLLPQQRSRDEVPVMPVGFFEELSRIVADAGQLSREIRMLPDVIYHWPPTFKDEEFDPERMECMNITSMMQNSPYEIKKQPNGQRDRSVLRYPTENSEAIVRITAFPGVVAHRKGGGQLAKRLLDEEERQERKSGVRLPPDVKQSRDISRRPPLNGTEGFRTRVICKSVVHLQWGKQRLLTKEAGTSRHLDAMRDGAMKKYEDDRWGFVELFDHFLDVHKDFDRGSY